MSPQDRARGPSVAKDGASQHNEDEIELAFFLQKGQPGDPDIHEVLVEHYVAGVCRLLAAILDLRYPKTHLAGGIRELTRRVFKYATVHVDRFWGEASVRNWLYRIAFQSSRRQQRWRGIRRFLNRLRPGRLSGRVNADLESWDETWKMVDCLPERLRLPLILRNAFKLEIADIAYILKVDPKKLHARLSKARERLSAEVSDQGKVFTKHAQYIQLVHKQLDGLLEGYPEIRDQLHEHLITCEGCKAYAEALQAFDDKLSISLQDRWPHPDFDLDTKQAFSKISREELKLQKRLPRLSVLTRQAIWMSAMLSVLGIVAWYFIRVAPQENDFPIYPTPTATPLPTPIMAEVEFVPEIQAPVVSGNPQTSFLSLEPSLSYDGRWIAFSSNTELPEGHSAGRFLDVLVYDQQTLGFERFGRSGHTLNEAFIDPAPSISADGRWVSFSSDIASMGPDDVPCSSAMQGVPCSDIFLHDRETGLAERITRGYDGGPATGSSFSPSISGDGRWVAFWSEASNLVRGDDEFCGDEGQVYRCLDIFVYDRQADEMKRVPIGASANEEIPLYERIELSSDGRWLAFTVGDSDMIASRLGLSQSWDVFVYDLQNSEFELVNLSSNGTPGDGPSFSPALSEDGRYVAFLAESSNLVVDDTNRALDVFVRDRVAGTIERVSISSDRGESNRDSGIPMMSSGGRSFGAKVSLSADGRYVAFLSQAGNLTSDTSPACQVSNESGCSSIYVYDREVDRIELVARSQGDDFYLFLDISGDGRWVAYTKVLEDCSSSGGVCADVIVHDRDRGWYDALTNELVGSPASSWTFVDSLQAPEGVIRSLAYSPDGSKLAAAVNADTVRVWDLEGNAATLRLQGMTKSTILTLAFSPNGEWLAGGTTDGIVNIWRVSDGYRIYNLSRHPGRIHSVLFSPDSRMLIVGTPQKVWVWEYGDRKFVRMNAFAYPGDSIADLSLSPTDNLLAVAQSDQTVWLQRLPGGQTVARLGGHKSSLGSVAFSPDGKYLAARSLEGNIVLWQINMDGMGGLSAKVESVFSLPYWLGDLAFSADGRYLASGSIRDGLRMWRIPEGELVDTLLGDIGQTVPVVAFSPRGSSMAAGSGDEVYMWRAHEAVGVSRFFARTSSDAYELDVIDASSIGGDLDESNSYLTLYQVDAQVEYDLLAPTKLPARVTFREARALSDQVIVLIYDVAGPQGIDPVASIYIVEHLVYVDFIGFTSGKYTLPLEAFGLPRNNVVRRGYVFSSNIPSEFIGYTVGASADVSNAQIDTRFGEYVRGDWQIASLPEGGSDSEILAPSIELNWDSESSAQRMRWQHGSLLLTIYYSPLDGTGDPGVHLSKDDLIQIAEGMFALHQTSEPGTILTSYRVAQWDTCWGVALQYDTTIATLVRLNNLSADCDLIYEGDSLLVPLPVARLPVAETDMDCDSRPERIEVIPSPTSESANLTYGVVLEKLTDIGIYQEVWRYTVADAGVRFITRPAVFSTGECQPFMAVNVLDGEDFGLKLFRWDGNEMTLVWSAEGAAMNIDAMDGMVTEMATLNLFYDSVTETCTRTTTAYSWNGEAFVEISRNSVAGGSCEPTD